MLPTVCKLIKHSSTFETKVIRQTPPLPSQKERKKCACTNSCQNLDLAFKRLETVCVRLFAKTNFTLRQAYKKHQTGKINASHLQQDNCLSARYTVEDGKCRRLRNERLARYLLNEDLDLENESLSLTEPLSWHVFSWDHLQG